MKPAALALSLLVLATCGSESGEPDTTTGGTDELCELARSEAVQLAGLDGGELTVAISNSDVVDYLDRNDVSTEAFVERCRTEARAWSAAVEP